MAIDELLTDNDFWSAYKNPELGRLFDPYLIQYKAHPSQKDKPGYDPDNTQWYAAAKKDPKIIDAVAKSVEKQKNAQEVKTELKKTKKTASGGWLPTLTQSQAAFGLAAIVLVIAAASTLGAAAPLAYSTTLAYTSLLY